jgi:hypothetical protein
VPNFLYEWGFAIPNDKPPLWIDNQWLDISQPISLIASSNPVLLFGKKLFSKDDETDLLLLPPYLLSLLFNQLLSMYLTGMFFCSAYKAVRLSALSAYNEISTSSYLTSLVPTHKCTHIPYTHTHTYYTCTKYLPIYYILAHTHTHINTIYLCLILVDQNGYNLIYHPGSNTIHYCHH